METTSSTAPIDLKFTILQKQLTNCQHGVPVFSKAHVFPVEASMLRKSIIGRSYVEHPLPEHPAISPDPIPATGWNTTPTLSNEIHESKATKIWSHRYLWNKQGPFGPPPERKHSPNRRLQTKTLTFAALNTEAGQGALLPSMNRPKASRRTW